MLVACVLPVVCLKGGFIIGVISLVLESYIGEAARSVRCTHTWPPVRANPGIWVGRGCFPSLTLLHTFKRGIKRNTDCGVGVVGVVDWICYINNAFGQSKSSHPRIAKAFLPMTSDRPNI